MPNFPLICTLLKLMDDHTDFDFNPLMQWNGDWLTDIINREAEGAEQDQAAHICGLIFVYFRSFIVATGCPSEQHHPEDG